MTGKIFLSYRRDDTTWFARALFSQLERSFPAEALFMDVKGIEPGQDFVRAIEKQVMDCDAMLVLIGPNWLKVSDGAGRRRLDEPTDFVSIEVGSALRFGKRVIPVLEPRTEMPSVEALPESLKDLARRNAVGLTHERFETDVQELIKALEKVLVEAEEARQRAEAEQARQRAMAAAIEDRRRFDEERNAREATRNPLSAKSQEMRKRLGGIL